MKLRLDEIMNGAGLQSSQLAEMTGLTQCSIGAIRRNKRKGGCNLYTAYVIAKALGCSIDNLIEEVKEMSKTQAH